MQLIQAALRHPITVMIVVVGIVLGSLSAIGKPIAQGLGLPWPDALPQGMEVDIFPALDLPVIYVCQPYGGMDPAQTLRVEIDLSNPDRLFRPGMYAKARIQLSVPLAKAATAETQSR